MKIFVLLVSGVTLTATAQSATVPALFDELVACQAIEEPSQRLACYDPLVLQLAVGLQAAAIDPDPAGVEPLAQREAELAAQDEASPQLEPEDESLPTMPPEWARAPEPQAEPDADGPRAFDGVVVRIVRLNSGRHLFFTEDGAVWEQTQDVNVRLPASLPANVEFRRRLTGNPAMSFEGTRAAYRVRRIE